MKHMRAMDIAQVNRREVTFDELFSQHRLTAKEREQLVVYLATLRAMNTLRVLTQRPEAAKKESGE